MADREIYTRAKKQFDILYENAFFYIKKQFFYLYYLILLVLFDF